MRRELSRCGRGCLGAACALVLVALGGCSADADNAPRGTRTAANSNDAIDGGSPVRAAAEACAETHRTRPCRCGDAAGRQVCAGGRWSPCECLELAGQGAGAAGAGAPGLSASGQPEANKLDATFTWLRSGGGSGDVGGDVCQPGHYAGAMDGLYNAPTAFNAPVPVVSVDVTGAPGLQLDLERSGNGEFLVVSGGSFNGTALAIFPFVGEFADGRLDCSTGEFRAKIINGSYVVFFEAFYAAPVTYYFEGEAVARYDPQLKALVDGRWSVAEGGMAPPAIEPGQDPPLFPPGQAGGTGTWGATWAY